MELSVTLHQPHKRAELFGAGDRYLRRIRDAFDVKLHSRHAIVRLIGEPADVFRKILHSLTGNFQQTQNFAYSFTLAETDAALLLLHTIDSGELADVRDALLVSPDIAEKSGDELLESMAHHGERFLKAVVAASRKRPFEVTYRLAVGDVVPTVGRELERGDYGLLVVGSHRDGHSYLAASDYQLMHTVLDIPVLAL